MKTEAETRGMRPRAHRCLRTPQELEEAGETLPRSLRRELSPAEILISDFWLPEP